MAKDKKNENADEEFDLGATAPAAEASADGTEEEKKPKVAYWKTEKGKAAHKKWSESEKGKERMKAYRQSDKYREMRTKYQNSEKGKAARKRYQEKRKAMLKAAKTAIEEGVIEAPVIEEETAVVS